MELEVVPCQRTFFPWSHFHGSISKKCILKPLGPLLGVIERGPKEANMPPFFPFSLVTMDTFSFKFLVYFKKGISLPWFHDIYDER